MDEREFQSSLRLCITIGCMMTIMENFDQGRSLAVNLKTSAESDQFSYIVGNRTFDFWKYLLNRKFSVRRAYAQLKALHAKLSRALLQ